MQSTVALLGSWEHEPHVGQDRAGERNLLSVPLSGQHQSKADGDGYLSQRSASMRYCAREYFRIFLASALLSEKCDARW